MTQYPAPRLGEEKGMALNHCANTATANSPFYESELCAYEQLRS